MKKFMNQNANAKTTKTQADGVVFVISNFVGQTVILTETNNKTLFTSLQIWVFINEVKYCGHCKNDL